jgi:hypothetical protein
MLSAGSDKMKELSYKKQELVNCGTFLAHNNYNQNIILMGSPHFQVRRTPLTICIAAIGTENDQECIVFATDHMVSMNMGEEHGYWKFEHSIRKFKTINNNTIVMFAGNPLVIEELLNDTIGELNYTKIKNKIQENFKILRNKQLKNGLYDIFGIDEQFMRDNLGKEISNKYIERILDSYFEFSVGTSILLIGFEEYCGKPYAMITSMNESGVVDFRELAFHAIGSGDSQAINTLLFQQHSKGDPILTTVYDVFKAKKFAEVCEGVGQKTDLGILRITGKTMIKSEDMEDDKGILKRLYTDEMETARKHESLKSLIIS